MTSTLLINVLLAVTVFAGVFAGLWAMLGLPTSFTLRSTHPEPVSDEVELASELTNIRVA
jgi:hypothetical protein